MENLNWGYAGEHKILNAELLNKSNISKFVKQDYVDIINRALYIFHTERVNKRYPNEKDKFLMTTTKLDNGAWNISLLGKDGYIRLSISLREGANPSTYLVLETFDNKIKINSTKNSIKINLSHTTLIINKNDDGMFSYTKLGVGKICLKDKHEPAMKKANPTKSHKSNSAELTNPAKY